MRSVLGLELYMKLFIVCRNPFSLNCSKTGLINLWLAKSPSFGPNPRWLHLWIYLKLEAGKNILKFLYLHFSIYTWLELEEWQSFSECFRFVVGSVHHAVVVVHCHSNNTFQDSWHWSFELSWVWVYISRLVALIVWVELSLSLHFKTRGTDRLSWVEFEFTFQESWDWSFELSWVWVYISRVVGHNCGPNCLPTPTPTTTTIKLYNVIVT